MCDSQNTRSIFNPQKSQIETRSIQAEDHGVSLAFQKCVTRPSCHEVFGSYARGNRRHTKGEIREDGRMYGY